MKSHILEKWKYKNENNDKQKRQVDFNLSLLNYKFEHFIIRCIIHDFSVFNFHMFFLDMGSPLSGDLASPDTP